MFYFYFSYFSNSINIFWCTHAIAIIFNKSAKWEKLWMLQLLNLYDIIWYKKLWNSVCIHKIIFETRFSFKIKVILCVCSFILIHNSFSFKIIGILKFSCMERTCYECKWLTQLLYYSLSTDETKCKRNFKKKIEHCSL